MSESTLLEMFKYLMTALAGGGLSTIGVGLLNRGKTAADAALIEAQTEELEQRIRHSLTKELAELREENRLQAGQIAAIQQRLAICEAYRRQHDPSWQGGT